MRACGKHAGLPAGATRVQDAADREDEAAAPRFSYDQFVLNRWVNSLFSRLIAGRAGPMQCFLETLFLCPLRAFARRQKPV